MLYLFLAVLSSAAVSVLMRLSEAKIKNNMGLLCMNYVMCTALAYGYAGFGQPFPKAEGLTWAVLLGTINGVLYLVSFVLLQTSIKKNGVVLSTTFMKLGLLVTMVISVCCFGEIPGAAQTAGFLLAVASIILINYQPGQRAAGSKWGLILLLLGGGAADSMSKIYGELGAPGLSDHFLLYTFLVALLLCAVLTAREKKGLPGKWEILFGLLIGIPNFLCSKFLLRALKEVAAVIVYPVYSVAGILVVTLAGVLLFKERLEKRQWLALALILAALVLLNIS